MVLSLWVAHSIFLNRRLLQSQSRYRQFFNDSPVAHIVIDKHHKTIEWNLTAEITFGWKEDEAKQKNIINFLVPEFNRSQRTGQKAALYFIDLNDFKLINDQFGHDAGDMLLKSIGHNLRACLLNTDTICRYGGDEFVVIIENIKDKDYIEAVFETIPYRYLRTDTNFQRDDNPPTREHRDGALSG